MGNEFDLKIGMTTQQIMSNLDKYKTTDKIKQRVTNFCYNDQDKKITNEVELAMLNSWISGSEKVKMPVFGGMTQIKQPVGYLLVEKDKGTLYKASDNRLLGTYYNDREYYNVVYSSHKYQDFVDELIDKDNDGYADARKTIKLKELGNNLNIDGFVSHLETIITFDDNIDGIFDSETKEEEIHYDEFVKINKTQTDLKTNKVEKILKTYDIFGKEI